MNVEGTSVSCSFLDQTAYKRTCTVQYHTTIDASTHVAYSATLINLELRSDLFEQTRGSQLRREVAVNHAGVLKACKPATDIFPSSIHEETKPIHPSTPTARELYTSPLPPDLDISENSIYDELTGLDTRTNTKASKQETPPTLLPLYYRSILVV